MPRGNAGGDSSTTNIRDGASELQLQHGQRVAKNMYNPPQINVHFNPDQAARPLST
jgi:hypothetical protein